MPTSKKLNQAEIEAIELLLTDAPYQVMKLALEFDCDCDEIRDVLANIPSAKETKDGWIIKPQTPEAIFREQYSFTPTKEQMDVLRNQTCSIIFNTLSTDSFKGVSSLAKATSLKEAKIKKGLEQLKKADLANGSEDAWLKNDELEEIEETRQRLLVALNRPMIATEWIEPFETDWNQEIISSAIALLNQEGLIKLDESGKYVPLVEVEVEKEQNEKFDDVGNGYPDVECDHLDISFSLAEVRIDGGTQPRTEINNSVISDYVELMQDGISFPPITVVFDGVDYWLVDGFHRYHAARQAQYTLKAEVINGSHREAVLYSVSVNSTHGLRRTNADKRKAVKTLLQDEEWTQWSDRAIARKCQVSNQLVSNMRKDLSVNDGQMGESSEYTKVRRGDQEYQQKRKKKESSDGLPKEVNATDAIELDTTSETINLVPSLESQFTPTIKEIEPDNALTSAFDFAHQRRNLHESICNFLGVDNYTSKEWFNPFYIISRDLQVDTERLFYSLQSQEISEGVFVTSNQDGSQSNLQTEAHAVCVVSGLTSFCEYVIWYFGDRSSQFVSEFARFGLTTTIKGERND